jgi:hypothetical protein
VIGPQTPFLDALAKRNATRSYVLAANALMGRSEEDRLDAGLHLNTGVLSDLLLKAARAEEYDPAPPCFHGLMEACVACAWEDE